MARFNIGILGISKLKWMGMGTFHLGDHNIYYSGQESLRKNGVALTVNKWVQNAVLGYNPKSNRMIPVCFQEKPFNIAIIQVCAPTMDAKEAEADCFYKDLQHLLELTMKKICPFHHKGLDCKNRKSRDPQNNKQTWPWNTKWNRAKTNRVLSREHAGHSKHPFPTTQEMTLQTDITRWLILKIRLIMFFTAKNGEAPSISKNKIWKWLWVRSWAPYCKILA